MDNYTGVYRTTPQSLPAKGEEKGIKKVLVDRFTLTDGAAAGLDVDDIIYGPILPADVLVLNVKAGIDKSVGATGIFSIGHAASSDGTTHAADADAFIVTIDAGGQAAYEECPAGAAGLFGRFTEEVQITATCTEVMDDSVVDAVLTVAVEYVDC